MSQPKTRKTEVVTFAVEPEMRQALENEAQRRESSMASVVRALVRAHLHTDAHQAQRRALV